MASAEQAPVPVTDTETMSETMLGKEASHEELSTMGSIQSLEQMSESENPKRRLQAAFLQHSRGNINEAEQLLATVGDLNSAAIQLSHEMINEIPTHDPRWTESSQQSRMSLSQVNTGKSLLIQRQIADKIKMHTVFVQFIQESIDSDAIGEIGQDGEKLVVAQALRNVNSTLQVLIDQVITVVIHHRGVRIPPSLTHQDLFYSQVGTRFYRIYFYDFFYLDIGSGRCDICPGSADRGNATKDSK